MNGEINVLNHYNLTNAFPTTWPAEKDESDDTEEEKVINGSKTGVRRSKSRYSALDRKGSDGRRSLVPGSQKLRDGQEALVQKDEADPLGASETVVQALRQKGLPVEEDAQLRNRFLLSSTTFSPNLYLSQVHSNASTQQLLQGLNALSRSIDQKSASLKVLVESNFERFVRAKTTIDNVYAEMRNQGAEPESDRSPRTHHRISSRGSTHFRNPSGQGPPTPSKGIHKPLPSDKKKNALTKESEYGVQGIKAPLIEVTVKAEEIWGPALGGRERERTLKTVLDSIERAEGVFEVDKTICDCIKRRDYDGLIEAYSRARKYTQEARNIAGNATRDRTRLTDSQIYQIVIIGRMWLEVEERISSFKRDVWHKLTTVQNQSMASIGESAQDEHMSLIGILLELGTEDNPIWIWLLSRYDYLKTKIAATFERSRVEIEVLRRRLAHSEPPSIQVVAGYLKRSGEHAASEKNQSIDTSAVVELWDMIYDSLINLLSVKRGLLGEVLEFWDRSQGFIDGKAQKTLPIGIDGRSRDHHRLSQHGVKTLQKGAVELLGMLQDDVFSFFADPPIDDISALYSPVPDTPNSPAPATPHSATLSPFGHQDSRFKFDKSNPPPSSPRKGEAWEEFAFWPPFANSLSGVHYLDKILTLLGSSASDMLAMRPAGSGNSLPEKLRTMVSVARERCMRAVCAAWGKDAEMCKFLEDWSRANDRNELTNMPSRLAVFEGTILTGMQKILYIPEAASTKSGSAAIISPPPTKLVQTAKSQLVTSLYKVLSGMIENAEKNQSENEEAGDLGLADDHRANTDGKSKSVRKLLTLSNLGTLQSNVIPSLISQFEINFSLPLAEESKTIRDALSQISDRLFVSYTQPTAAQLSNIVHAGISSPDWLPATARPSAVKPYVYEALLLLVYIHSEVSTTAPQLTNQILSHLLEHMSSAFLAAFKQRSRYPLASLMQATLDVEFVAQTMSQYTTKKASEMQSEIYIQLDQGTTPDASKRLQGELPEMRQVLKRLREGTRSEFLCFKREKKLQS